MDSAYYGKVVGPPWLDLVAKLSEIVGALAGVLALVRDVLDKGKQESRPEPGYDSSAPIPRGWLRVATGLLCIPLVALALQVGGLMRPAFRTGVDAVAATAGLAALLALGMHVIRIRRQRLPLPDGLLTLLDRQWEDSQSHQYGYSVGSAPPILEIYVDQWAEWRARIPIADTNVSIPLTIAQMLEKSRNVIVLAEPGVGKSTAINQVIRQQSAWWRGATRSARPRDAPYGPFMPIALPPDLHGCHRLPDAMARQWEQLTSFKADPRMFERKPPYAQSWLVLIDGIDQVLSTRARSDALVRVGGWAAAGSAPYRFMITSRPLLSGELGPLKAEHVDRFILRKFDAEGLEHFASRWAAFRASQHFDDMDMEPITTERFLGAIKAASLGQLARIPLIATITALILEASKETALPASRAGLYERFVQHLFSSRRLEQLRLAVPAQFALHGRRGERAWAWLLDNLRDLLEGIADSHLSVDSPSVSECAVKWIQGNAPGGMFEAIPGWDDAVGGLLTATSLIIPGPHGLSFAHLNFAEYLAAGPRSKAFDLETWLADVRSPDSRSLALFVLARQARETPAQQGPQLADRLAELLLDRGGAEACLAGSIIADGVEITQTLRVRIVDILFELLERDEETTEALSVLVSIIGEIHVLDRLIGFTADPTQHDWARADVAEELCAITRDTGVRLLRQILEGTSDSLLQHRIRLRLAALNALTPDELALIGRYESELTDQGVASSGARAGYWYRQIAEDEANEPRRRLHAVLAMAERRDPGWENLFHVVIINPQLTQEARLDAGRRAMRLADETGTAPLRRVADQAGLALEVRVPLLAAMAEAQDEQARRVLNQLSATGGAGFRERFPSVTAWREEIGVRSSERPGQPDAGRPGTVSDFPAVWGDVPTRNKNFTGRDDILQRLRASRDNILRGLDDTFPMALQGLGGVGKTALALEYAHRYRSDYDLVWWIPADQLPSVRASLATLASRLNLDSPATAGIDGMISAVLDALQRGEPYSRWLLIFDNADQPEDINHLIPRGPGDVLITSRNLRWQGVTNTIPMDVFVRPESTEFLRKRAPRGLSESDAINLAENLGDLPLALEQAGAMLSETGMPVDEYLHLLRESVTSIMAEGKSPDYPFSMTAAWKLSVASLQRKIPQALDLLRCCAFFGPEPIPRDVFRRSGQSTGTGVAEMVSDPILMASMMRELSRYALVTLDGNTVRVHRLIQRLLRDELTAEEQAAYRHDALLILAAAGPANPDDMSSWPRFAELLPHIAAESAELPKSLAPEVRDLALRTMRYVYQAGDYESGLALTERCIEQWTKDSGPENPDVLRAKRHLGNTLRLLGRYADSYQVTDTTLASARLVLGESDPTTLSLRSAFAADLRASGNFAVARELDEESRVLLENAYGPDDLRSLRMLSSLALDHGLNSDYQKARDLYQQAFLRMSPASSEASASDVLGVWTGLSRTLRLTGLYREAFDVSQDALDFGQDPGGLGPEHLLTLRSVKEYTVVCRWLPERRLDAVLIARDALELSSRRFGESHPDTLAIAVSLGNLLRTVSEDYHGEALALAESTAERYPRVYGANHPYNYGCLSNLALMRRITGDPAGAHTLDEQALEGLRAALGPDHHFTLAVAINLASDLAALGRAEDARNLGEDTLPRLTGLLGPSHSHTLDCAANLALDLITTGEEVAGKTMRDKTLELFGETYGHDFPDVIMAGRGNRLDVDFDPPSI